MVYFPFHPSRIRDGSLFAMTLNHHTTAVSADVYVNLGAASQSLHGIKHAYAHIIHYNDIYIYIYIIPEPRPLGWDRGEFGSIQPADVDGNGTFQETEVG